METQLSKTSLIIKDCLWLTVIIFVYLFVQFGLEQKASAFFPNLPEWDAYQDEHEQPYLIGIDSYYYLNKANHVLNNPDKASYNSVVNFYKSIGTIAKSFSTKPLKYFLYYIPLVLGSLCLLIFFMFFRENYSLPETILACLLLLSSPSFFINTQIGMIDHNGFYILAFLIILFANNKNLVISLSVIPVTLDVVSTFWGSWILLLIPTAVLLLFHSYQEKRIHQSVKLGFIALLIVAFIIAIKQSDYLSVLINKLLSFFNIGLGTTTPQSKFHHTEELQSVDIFYLIKAEPITLLFLLCPVAITLLQKNKLQTQYFFLFFFIGLIYLFLTLSFVRISIFFAIVGIIVAISIFHLAAKKKQARIVFGIIFIIVIALNIHNIIKLHTNTARLNDNDIQQYSTINELTEPNAIILSWWDFGNYINVYSERYAFLESGPKNSINRLSLFANIVYANDSNSIELVRQLACQDLNIQAQHCTQELTPIYLLMNHQFKRFHPHVMQYSNNDTQTKLMNHADSMFTTTNCDSDTSKEWVCGDYVFQVEGNNVSLMNENTKVGKIIFDNKTTVKTFDISDEELVLILVKLTYGYQLIETTKPMQETLAFQSLLPEKTDVFQHSLIYRGTGNNPFSIIKLNN